APERRGSGRGSCSAWGGTPDLNDSTFYTRRLVLIPDTTCYRAGMATQALDERRVGRPRRAAIDAAIIRAAVELMTEGGVDATTLTAVATRAGVARATVYLRWPTRSALVGAAARAAVGGQVFPLTGNVEVDVRVAAGWLQRVFELPSTPAMLPEIIRGVLADPPELSFDAVAPRRSEFARLYAQGAEAAGFDTAI